MRAEPVRQPAQLHIVDSRTLLGRLSWRYLESVGIRKDQVDFAPFSAKAPLEWTARHWGKSAYSVADVTRQVKFEREPFHGLRHAYLVARTPEAGSDPLALVYEYRSRRGRQPTQRSHFMVPFDWHCDPADADVAAVCDQLRGNLGRRQHWLCGMLRRPQLLQPRLLQEVAVDIVPHFPEVFSPQNIYLRLLLMAALPRLQRDERTLVLGSGSGVEAALAALMVRTRVDAVDINPFAVGNTAATAAFLGVEHLVRSWHSDGFARVPGRYDAIFLDAPRALPREQIPESCDSEALFDPDGQFLRRTFAELPEHLTRSGRLYLMADPDLRSHLPGTLRSRILADWSEPHPGSWTFAVHEVWPG